MSEMVERVARALDKAMGEQHDPTPGYLARAAMEAMREPTEAMLDASRHAEITKSVRHSDRNIWQAMIDAALR